MITLPDYDSVKLVALLKQCGNYRDQLAMIVHFLHRTGALGVYQNWLDTKLNTDEMKGETADEKAQWDEMFKEPHVETVSVNLYECPTEIVGAFHKKLNALHRYGISCEEIVHPGNDIIDYKISVERDVVSVEVAPSEEEIKQLISQHMTGRPSVGIALCIRRGNQVLIHKRKGKHAPGCWAFVGGHLEMYEDWEQAALREMVEEAGPDIKVCNVKYWTASNTKFHDEGKHYVVIFMVADWVSGEAQVMEPDKCECWEWHDWYTLPEPLMLGLQDLKNRNLNPNAPWVVDG